MTTSSSEKHKQEQRQQQQQEQEETEPEQEQGRWRRPRRQTSDSERNVRGLLFGIAILRDLSKNVPLFLDSAVVLEGRRCAS